MVDEDGWMRPSNPTRLQPQWQQDSSTYSSRQVVEVDPNFFFFHLYIPSDLGLGFTVVELV